MDNKYYIKEKKNDFIEENIYYYFSTGYTDNLLIPGNTELYEYVQDNNLLVENTPFSFYGKLMEKIDNVYIILSDNTKKIIFLFDKENIMKESKINEFNYYYAMKIRKFDDISIFLESVKISEIRKSSNLESMINSINQKILIKFNFYDYKIDNYYNKIGLEIGENINTITINNNTIYYVYEMNEISNEYFPQKIKLYKDENSIDFKLLVTRGYCNEINIFINSFGGYAYDYYYNNH